MNTEERFLLRSSVACRFPHRFRCVQSSTSRSANRTSSEQKNSRKHRKGKNSRKKRTLLSHPNIAM